MTAFKALNNWAIMMMVFIVFVSERAFCQTTNQQVDAKVFNPVLGSGADPWVIKDKGNYYMCLKKDSASLQFITVNRSAKLSAPGKPVIVWQAPLTGPYSTNVWAPELHHFGRHWYIYFAAGQAGPPFIYQRSFVLESVTADPQGAYRYKGRLQTGDDPADSSKTIWAIDFTATKFKGQMYGLWSGWERNALTDKTVQNLYIAKMANPWTISSARVKISSPQETWETGGPLNLNEGPEFLQHNGNLFVIYSTRESWTPEYRLGQLRLKDVTNSLLDADNWIKSGPVFQRANDIYGTGHASFTLSPNGKEWWIVYHAKLSESPGWDREIRLQPFTWKADGNPEFGTPVPKGKLLSVPAGEQ